MSQRPFTNVKGALLPLFVSLLFWTGCSSDSAKNHYLLAEKLWTDQKYAAAVSEFDKVISKDPKSLLAQRSLYRSAMIQALFLAQYNDAVQKFTTYIQMGAQSGAQNGGQNTDKGSGKSSNDEKSIWEAKLQIGEILFLKTEQYDQAIIHYEGLLKEKPQSAEAAEIAFRIAKSQFFILHFKEAIASYHELIKKYSDTTWAEKASFEIGTTYFTQGAQRGHESASDATIYKEAIKAFEKAMKTHPKSELVPDARFGIASCYEELDQLDEAYRAYTALKEIYPSPQVIEIKLNRIRERIAQRKDSH